MSWLIETRSLLFHVSAPCHKHSVAAIIISCWPEWVNVISTMSGEMAEQVRKVKSLLFAPSGLLRFSKSWKASVRPPDRRVGLVELRKQECFSESTR